MNKQDHLKYLRDKYIQLNEEYVHELKQGKSILLVKELSNVITTLAKEISQLEEEAHSETKPVH